MKSHHHPNTAKAVRPKLGEILIDQGALNAAQLEEAIEYQSLYGGRLGTSLIELGLVDENCMARALGRQLKLHCIKPRSLMNVPAPVIALVPGPLALKYKLVPYRKEGHKLYVAINDANNLQLLDELSFQLDHILIPLVVPEARLMLALKKHYGMKLSPRYEVLNARLERHRKAELKANGAARPDKGSATEPGEPPVSHPDPGEWPLLNEDPRSCGHDFAVYEVADTPASSERPSPPEAINSRLANAVDRNDIGRTILDCLSQDFPESALFVVREQIASGWLASGCRNHESFEGVQIDLEQPSILQTVVRTGEALLGPLPDTAINRKILEIFAARPSAHALTLPLTVQDRLVGLLYLNGPRDLLEQQRDKVRSLIAKAEMAFKILILKNKILNS